MARAEANRSRLVKDIQNWMCGAGFVPGTEQYDICSKALSFLGWHYEQNEELARDRTIDCSTLVSQAHWEGAAIGIPFVAENQRAAASGISVELDHAIPGDVVVKYRSLEDSPEGRWNHVGLYLGKNLENREWLIESRGGDGVRLTSVEEFDPRGGIKRFTLSTHVFDSGNARCAMALTQLVPKLGRLGARQYSADLESRHSHRGLDLYSEPGTPVYSTLAGVADVVFDPFEQAFGVEITDARWRVRFLMLEEIEVSSGDLVQEGSVLGLLREPSRDSKLKYLEGNKGKAHLHLELESLRQQISEAPGVMIDGRYFVNHLYLSKIGTLGVPFKE